MLPPCILPVAVIRPAVSMLPPVMLAADVSVPVTLIRPVVRRLPPVMLPVALNTPVTNAPVLANTAKGLTPVTLTMTLDPEPVMVTLELPFCIDVVSMPDSWLPLPKK